MQQPHSQRGGFVQGVGVRDTVSIAVGLTETAVARGSEAVVVPRCQSVCATLPAASLPGCCEPSAQVEPSKQTRLNLKSSASPWMRQLSTGLTHETVTPVNKNLPAQNIPSSKKYSRSQFKFKAPR